MQSAPSTGLLRGWTFKIMLLAMSLSCFIGTIANTYDRLQLSNGVPATIECASGSQKAPSDWSEYEGRVRSQFYVKVKTTDGKESFSTLYLTKEVIDGLVNGKQSQIIFVRDNPRRFLMKGEPLPSFGLGWALMGAVFLAVFLYSLKLR